MFLNPNNFVSIFLFFSKLLSVSPLKESQEGIQGKKKPNQQKEKKLEQLDVLSK